MAYVFCNQCGHRNPPESNFCSSCGAPLDVTDDRTITIAKVDPHQDAIGPDDDIVVPLSDINQTAVLIVRSGP
nr:zinc-ribbon domain-containing protein [Ilumatobacteraceae bacterium]